MTNKETINRNIGLTFDFLKRIKDDTNLLDKIENDQTIEFLQKDYPEKKIRGEVVAHKFIKVKREFEII